MLAFPPQDRGMLRPSLDSHQQKTGFGAALGCLFATIRRSSRGRKQRLDINTWRVCVCCKPLWMCLCVGTELLVMGDRHKSPLLFFLSVASVRTQLDGDVDCFSMTAAVWALGWTVFNAPLQCLEGNTIWPHAYPTAKLWNKCSLLHYLLSHYHSSRWEQSLKPHSGGNNMLALCVSASVDHTGTGVLHSILFFSFLHYFDYNYASGLWFSYKRFANSAVEKGYASLLLCYFSYYYTTTSAEIWNQQCSEVLDKRLVFSMCVCVCLSAV